MSSANATGFRPEGAEYVRDAAESAQSRVEQVKEAAQEKLAAVKDAAAEYYDQGVDAARQWSSNVQGYVRREPTKALAVAAGLGFAIGMLLRRR